MFDIEYKGGNAVIIATKGSKLILDPKLSLVGLKDLAVKDSVELATEPRFLVNDPAARMVLEGPGEYEVGDFSIKGIPVVRHIDDESSKPGSTIYRIDVGEVGIAVFGNISGNLNEDQLEAIGLVDILIIPVGGGGYTLDYTNATRLVRQIEPKVVIPIHYADTAIQYEVPQDPLSLFTNELDVPIESVDKYKLKSETALPSVMTIYELRRS